LKNVYFCKTGCREKITGVYFRKNELTEKSFRVYFQRAVQITKQNVAKQPNDFPPNNQIVLFVSFSIHIFAR